MGGPLSYAILKHLSVCTTVARASWVVLYNLRATGAERKTSVLLRYYRAASSQLGGRVVSALDSLASAMECNSQTIWVVYRGHGNEICWS